MYCSNRLRPAVPLWVGLLLLATVSCVSPHREKKTGAHPCWTVLMTDAQAKAARHGEDPARVQGATAYIVSFDTWKEREIDQVLADLERLRSNGETERAGKLLLTLGNSLRESKKGETPLRLRLQPYRTYFLAIRGDAYGFIPFTPDGPVQDEPPPMNSIPIVAVQLNSIGPAPRGGEEAHSR